MNQPMIVKRDMQFFVGQAKSRASSNVCVTSIEQRFDRKMATFVTDDASIMVKIRRQLEADSITSECNIISYGCSAHYFHLLAKM